MKIFFKYKEKSRLKFGLLMLGCTLFYSCRKPTNISGHVYSKHYQPVPNAQIIIAGYDGVGGKRTNYFSTIYSDNNGEFMKSVTLNRRSTHFVIVASSDSGGVVLDDQKINDLKNLTLKIQ